MDMTPVESSQISAIGHDPAKNVMAIQFHGRKGGQLTPGSVYHYQNVTPEQHQAFIGADSLGVHFGQHFKSNDNHPFKKIELDE